MRWSVIKKHSDQSLKFFCNDTTDALAEMHIAYGDPYTVKFVFRKETQHLENQKLLETLDAYMQQEFAHIQFALQNEVPTLTLALVNRQMLDKLADAVGIEPKQLSQNLSSVNKLIASINNVSLPQPLTFFKRGYSFGKQTFDHNILQLVTNNIHMPKRHASKDLFLKISDHFYSDTAIMTGNNDYRITLRFNDIFYLSGNWLMQQLFITCSNAVKFRQVSNPLQYPNIERLLAVNPESAMLDLLSWQEQVMENVNEKYQGKIAAQGGYLAVLSNMQEKLEELYNANPIKFSFRGDEITLPLKWEDLLVTKEEYIAKLKERYGEGFGEYEAEQVFSKILSDYHKHEIHTAYRYFLTPNQWIAPDAEHVRRDIDGLASAQRAGFGEMIALLWQAASDPAEATVGKLSVADRQGAFLGQIAEINRGHNRDGGRDDGRGDDPTCNSGVKGDLFSAVLDHSAFKFPAVQIAKLELQSFLANIYTQAFKQMSNETFDKVFDALNDVTYIEELNTDKIFAPNITADFINYTKKRMLDIDATTAKEVGTILEKFFADMRVLNQEAKTNDASKQDCYVSYNFAMLDSIIGDETVARKTRNHRPTLQ